MARVQDQEYPDHFFYDVENQIWYEALPDGKIRAGMTPIAVSSLWLSFIVFGLIPAVALVGAGRP